MLTSPPTATAATAAPGSPGCLAFAEFVLDLGAERLSRGGAAVPLAPRYYAVLAYLVSHGGRLVGKDELLDAVWGHRHVSDSALKVAVNAVRQALGDDPRTPRHLETVPRRGYRFIAAVERLAGPPAAPGVAPPAPTASVPVPAPGPALGNLPPALPDLVGRADALRQLAEALATHRLVTLHGPGGVGKTRLALAGAGRDAPPDGAWLLRLDALADAAPLGATLARTLGLGAVAEGGPATLVRALAPLRLRLVLDNAEHLLADVAALAAALLAGAPGVQLLVTSQRPLRIAGEQVLPLAPLAVDAPTDGSDPLSPAVRLLDRRVARLRPDLAFDADAAKAIAQALDGLPLALELAAARVPLLGWAGVRDRLAEGRFVLLTRGLADAPERHRTLQAALAWTTGLLAPATRRVLHRLSVMAGSFDIDTALAVAGEAGTDPSVVLDALDDLQDTALLVPLPAVAGHPATPRWQLYDSVRAHAAEGLRADGDADAALARLLAHLTRRFRAADVDFAHTPQRRWTAALQPEVPTLRSALRQGLARPALQPAAVALCAASAQFRIRGGWRREAADDHAAVRALALSDLPDEVAADLDLAEAQLAAVGQVWPPQPALEAARRARAAHARLGDLWREHMALTLEGGLEMRLQTDPARRHALLAAQRALEPPSWGFVARRHRTWQEVMLCRDEGDLAGFERMCLDYAANARAAGDEHGAWIAGQALVQVMSAQHRHAEALALMAETGAQMRAAGALRENAQVLAQWASLQIGLEGGDAARALLHEAVTMMRAEDRLWWMADALPWLPAWQGRWEVAARVQGWADGLVRERGDRRGLMFADLRARFGQRLTEQPDAARLQALVDAPSALDEAAVLALVFGGPGAAG